VKIVLVSDTHGLHKSVRIPEGDLLIHAGDLTNTGERAQLELTASWLHSLPHQHKVAIAGNHDWVFERLPGVGRRILEDAGVAYLQDTEVNIAGLQIYGSPWQPAFMNWAFNVPRGGLAQYWDLVPIGLDVLITHGPPYGILDQSIPAATKRSFPWEDEEPFAGSDHVGCEQLLAAIERSKPRVHVFGHIHGGYGRTANRDTSFYNASLCNERYDPINQPWVIDLGARPLTTAQSSPAPGGSGSPS